jgi:hypothetical protein
MIKKYYLFINLIVYSLIAYIINLFNKDFINKYSFLKNLRNLRKIKYISNRKGNQFFFEIDWNKINKLSIDSTFSSTDLCYLGKNFGTDKSPYNISRHRHPYTSVYSLIFSSIKDKKINFAEIGIDQNKSIKVFRKYFSNAYIYGFDSDFSRIKNANRDNLYNTKYFFIDVKKNYSINLAFKSTKKKFDIVIDDSTHEFEDQIRIIKNIYKFLNQGAILIIEDVFQTNNSYSEKNFYKSIGYHIKFYRDIIFIDCNHFNKFSGDWKNDRLILLIKK